VKFILIVSLTFTFVFGLALSVMAQNGVREKNMIGFGCYYEGRQSQTVQKVSRQVSARKYNAIARLLRSRKAAACYMAVITIEKLEETGEYRPTDKEKLLMAEIKKSQRQVSVCSGCTYFENLPLSEVFSRKLFVKDASWWFEHITYASKMQ
jgi:hypothetical protein